MKKKDFSVSVQVFSGGFEGQQVGFEAVKSKLDWIYDRFYLEGAIIGWSKEKELYLRLKEYLHSRGSKIYLWFPVFSELGYFRAFDPVLDCRGEAIDRYELKQGERFEFYCPASRENLDRIKDIYSENYSSIGFDGVFLDKIRYPSFANGPKAVFSCFCPKCRAAMEEYGIDPNRAAAASKEAMSGRPIQITGYARLHYEFADPLWQGFFDFKNYTAGRSVKTLSQYFRSMGLEVGLDTFPPYLGYFIGQDSRLLLELGDFIKPMFYRRTLAPAGLPYETDRMKKIFSAAGGNERVEKILNAKGEHSFGEIVAAELGELLEREGISAVYPGFEVNRLDAISPVTAADISENLELYGQKGVKGAILSWDIMKAPEDNLLAVQRYLQEDGS